MQVATVEKGTKAFFTLRGVLKGTFLILIFAIILLTAIKDSVEQRSLTPLITEVGERAGTSLNTLNQESLEIMQSSSTPLKQGFFHQLVDFYTRWDGFFAQLTIIYIWIKIFMWVINKSMFSTLGDSFKTFLLSITFFFILQIIYMLVFSDQPKLEVLALPFHVVINFFKVLPILLDQLSEIINSIVPN